MVGEVFVIAPGCSLKVSDQHLSSLLESPNVEVRRIVAANPLLPTHLVIKALSDVDTLTQSEAVRPPRPVQCLLGAMRSKNVDTRVNAARNELVNETVLRLALSDDEIAVVSAAVSNPMLPEDRLLSALSHPMVSVRVAAVQNPNTRTSDLRVLVADKSADVRSKLSGHRNVSSDILDMLCTDDDPYVRASVLLSPVVSWSQVFMLMGDPVREVRRLAAGVADRLGGCDG